MRRAAVLAGALALAAGGACRRADRTDPTPHGEDVVAVPEQPTLSVLPYLGETPMGREVGGGALLGPETVVHDLVDDVYLVSNIDGDPNAQDGNGYISRVSPAGDVLERFFIDGREPGVELDAPRGMVIGGETLYVADETGIRLFDRHSGEPKGSWPVPGAQFLNALAIDARGRLLATETGITLLPTGPVKTGPYAIYAFDGDGTRTTLAEGDELEGPNGIVAGADGIFVVEFMGDEHGVYRLGDGGRKELVGTLPFGQLDGLAQLPDGSLLVSSWLANGIYRLLPGAPPRLVVEHLATPAGIAYDVLRDRILVPEVLGGAVHIERWARRRPSSGRSASAGASADRGARGGSGQGQARHAVAIEQRVDARLRPGELGLERGRERAIAAPHAEADREAHARLVGGDGRHDEHGRRLAREVAADGAPRDGRVDVAARDGVDELARRIGLAVVAVDGVADEVILQAAASERDRGRHVGIVVADGVDADAEAAQARIVERREIREVSIGARHEHVARPVVGARDVREVEADRLAHDDVAGAGVQRVADEAAPLGQPRGAHGDAEVGGDERRQRVLEALAALVAVRQVVGIGAHAQLVAHRWGRVGGVARRGAAAAPRGEDDEREGRGGGGGQAHGRGGLHVAYRRTRGGA